MTQPTARRIHRYGLGVLFFQGGTVSVVLVGTTVQPITDANESVKRNSATSSTPLHHRLPLLIAINAWPGYVQSLIFVPGVNGSVFGDQRLPISDTTILSSLVSGCDLMEPVRTQLVPALAAGVMVGWAILTAVLV